MKQLSRDGADFEAPPICLLVAVVEDEGETELLEPVLRWCVDNGFEMIEWSSKKDCSTQEGKTGSGSLLDSVETSGSARLAEALEAHMWPDVTMKSTPHVSEVDISKATKLSSMPEVDTTATTTILPENEKLLAEGEDGEKDGDGETFEEMFARFAEMKGEVNKVLAIKQH